MELSWTTGRLSDSEIELSRKEMNNMKKLYKITLKGMTTGVTYTHGIAYAVAENTDEAYQNVRAYLDNEDIGFKPERELKSIELIAECADYPDCGIKLYM